MINLGRIISTYRITLLAIIWIVCGCAAAHDPYTININGRDPRACALPPGKEALSNPVATAEEFKLLPRPVIVRYVAYKTTPAEGSREVVAYTHIVLADEACDFINRHTFDEMAVALCPMLKDPFFSGDVVAVLGTAAREPGEAGDMLSRCNYRSPQEPGSWPYNFRKSIATWGASTPEANLKILHGEILHKTPKELEESRKYLEALRKHGLWP